MNPAGVIEQLKELSALRAANAIDHSEFNELKHRLLAQTYESSLDPGAGSSAATITSSTTLISAGDSNSTSTDLPKVQATLHRFFGPSVLTSKQTGMTYVPSVVPRLITDRYVCPVCIKSCINNAALISHQKTHSAQASDLSSKTSQKSQNKGAEKRHRYSFDKKAKSIEVIEQVMKMQKVSRNAAAEQLSVKDGISKDTLLNWCKNADAIKTAAASFTIVVG